jgi:hypothetical protein
MLKLTISQLNTALYAAGEIHRLKVVIDQVSDVKHRVHFEGQKTAEDPLGCQRFVDVVVPKAEVRRQFQQRLTEAHNVLRSLGIELVHGGGSGG